MDSINIQEVFQKSVKDSYKRKKLIDNLTSPMNTQLKLSFAQSNKISKTKVSTICDIAIKLAEACIPITLYVNVYYFEIGIKITS